MIPSRCLRVKAIVVEVLTDRRSYGALCPRVMVQYARTVWRTDGPHARVQRAGRRFTGGSSMSLPDGVIYMDHAATTPLDPRVFERMRPYFSELFGNPSSIYGLGRKS